MATRRRGAGPSRARYEDDLPAFPGARFPLSDVPATTSSHSRAYSLTHDKQGRTIDNLNAPRDKTTRRYVPNKGGGGTWRNNNGTTLGHSLAEDSQFMPMKSTGDIPSAHAIHIHLHTSPEPLNVQKAAKLRNKLRRR